MGKLIIVPTPIGNLEDITFRAVRVLKEADLVLAEDTRVTRKLFSHYEIHAPLKAFHQHNEHQYAAQLALELAGPSTPSTGSPSTGSGTASTSSVAGGAEKTFALVSDAGTPGISDPAYLLVKACLEQGVEVECLPGATAFVPALVKSGLPSSSFCFEGFLPQKKGRATKLKTLADEVRTMVFYESPYRVIKTLEQFIATFGPERKASVSRELTKIYEETVNGTLTEILEYYNNHTIKGEFVIVVAGKN